MECFTDCVIINDSYYYYQRKYKFLISSALNCFLSMDARGMWLEKCENQCLDITRIIAKVQENIGQHGTPCASLLGYSQTQPS